MLCVWLAATGFSQAAESLPGLHVVSESLAASVRVTDDITVVAAAPAVPSKPRSCNCLHCWPASDITASFMLAGVHAAGRQRYRVRSRDLVSKGRLLLAQGREPDSLAAKVETLRCRIRDRG